MDEVILKYVCKSVLGIVTQQPLKEPANHQETLSRSQVSAAHLKMGHQQMKSLGFNLQMSCNDLTSSTSNGCQGNIIADMSYWLKPSSQHCGFDSKLLSSHDHWHLYCHVVSMVGHSELTRCGLVTPYDDWWPRPGSTLVQVMAWHLMPPSRHMVTETRVNIGSGNGLVPDGTKPLPEPMSTYHQQKPVVFMWGHHHENIWR